MREFIDAREAYDLDEYESYLDQVDSWDSGDDYDYDPDGGHGFQPHSWDVPFA